MVGRLEAGGAKVEALLRKVLVGTAERSVEGEGRRAIRSFVSYQGKGIEAGCIYTRVVSLSCTNAPEYLSARVGKIMRSAFCLD
jgi:hypothetical protein